jgi:hypothetical protein
MNIAGLLVGLLNCVLVAAILVLIGAIIVWVASAFQWPIPWNIQRIFLLIVLLVFIICAISLMVGAPMVHIFHY